ncbi:SDR family oxidoreductase [Actinokineospora spheciospongiae]|uniref:SDR family oxidoreductase n=1 Tax=Actinokineospora spheciospongiae TaxID=909613 RepID=UPI000D710DEF|nr:SDR family oxidoreductase [Actinokineospora spheciospongiae]PWW56174.1 3-oxoacyl-[acyl-carrier protein] reductase [Actinokineospora spheciospongiae]
MRHQGKRALVLCGTRGIGAGVALSLARRGAAVTVSGRDADRAAAAAAGLPGTGHGSFACDFADPAGVAAAAAAAGPFDIVLLNTPGHPPGPVDELSADGLRSAFETMLLPVRGVVDAVLPGMRRNRWGRLIAITSSSVDVPIPGLAGSTVVRSAVRSYLKLLAESAGPDGVTVNHVIPGKVDTDRLRSADAAAARRAGTSADAVRAATLAEIPVGRYGTPDDVGELVSFLAGDAAAYITGTGIRCDGGYVRAF